MLASLLMERMLPCFSSVRQHELPELLPNCALPAAAFIAPTWQYMYVCAGSSAIVVLAIVTYFAFFMLPYVHSHSIPEGTPPLCQILFYSSFLYFINVP